MAPPIPEALELYLKMMEGMDLKWSVGSIGEPSIMDTPLAKMALERGGSFRVGLEDWGTGPSDLIIKINYQTYSLAILQVQICSNCVQIFSKIQIHKQISIHLPFCFSNNV